MTESSHSGDHWKAIIVAESAEELQENLALAGISQSTLVTFEKIHSTIHNLEANLMVISSVSDLSVKNLFRICMQDPFLLCTPTIVLLQEHEMFLEPIFQKLGAMTAPWELFKQDQTITAASFTKLKNAWASPPYALLRSGVISALLKKNKQQNLAIFKNLSFSQKSTILSLPAYVLCCRELDQISLGEKLLLDALKPAPRQLHLLLALGDLYLNHAMPRLAYKIYHAIYEIVGLKGFIEEEIEQAMKLQRGWNG